MKALLFRRLSVQDRVANVKCFAPAILTLLFFFLPCRAIATVQTDVVFLLDRSGSVEQCVFDFQLAAISELICGGDCSQQSCSDEHLLHDGSVAVTVLTFGWNGGVETVVEKETLDETSSPILCATIRGFSRGTGNGATRLFAALEEAKRILEERNPAPLERVVIILSDTVSIGPDLISDPRPKAEVLRTMEGTPARISAFRFSDYPYGGFGPLDPECPESHAEELLAMLANLPGTPEYSPYQPSGVFQCGRVCPCENAAGCEQTQSCTTTIPWPPSSCHYSQQAIDDFVELAKASICLIPESSGAVTITQQPEQDPVPVMSTDEVTLTAAGVTDAAWLEPYYQWRLDGRILIGANEPELLLRRFDMCETGPYDCVIFSPCDVQVPVVGHQAVGEQTGGIRPVERGRQHPLEGLEVAILLEQRQPHDAAIQHVIDDARFGDAQRPRHAP